MIFGRVKPLDAILETAKKKSLHRSLGAFQLTMLGIGAIIGTGIFVLTAEAAQKAGPGMMLSFIIAACVCGVAAFCYAEMAAMVPVSGSAYTYSYAVMGELVAWMVGWALILEYAVAASAVSVGWSGYVVGLIEHLTGSHLPASVLVFTKGPFNGGIINLPAAFIALLIMSLLIRGTKESATASAILVVIKITALSLFIFLAIPAMKMENFHPFAPLGFSGISAAAACIFFAYVGFDAVSTAAEETKNPQRNMPIGLVGSLAICTLFYMLVSAGVIGGVGAQPVFDAAHQHALPAGSSQMAAACSSLKDSHVVCSNEALAWSMRKIGWNKVGNLIALAAGFALPSVILMMIFGQTRIFFVMSRDGLLPGFFAKVHPRFKTPYIVTIMTGLAVAAFSAFFPVGILADISNAGTLFAFAMVAIAVLVLRHTDPKRHRPFKTPCVYLIAPLAALGCLYLFVSLPFVTLKMFFGWTIIGLVVYFLYGYRHSNIARNIPDDEEA